MNSKLRKRDRQWFIVSEYFESDAPVLRRLWWLVEGGRGGVLGDGDDGRDLYHASGSDTYSFQRERSGAWVNLFLSGQSIATHVESEPVPAPKSRCEVRWRNGRWEKNLARSGWVIA